MRDLLLTIDETARAGGPDGRQWLVVAVLGLVLALELPFMVTKRNRRR